MPIFLKVNERKLFDYCANQSHLKLTSRLQLRHNLNVAEMLLPSVLTHTIVMAILIGCTFWLTQSTEGVSYTPIQHGIYYLLHVIVILYISVHPLVCFRRCHHLRDEARKMLRVQRFPINTVTGQGPRLQTCAPAVRRLSLVSEMDESTAHFKLLEAIWRR